jgi:hypothetical protein
MKLWKLLALVLMASLLMHSVVAQDEDDDENESAVETQTESAEEDNNSEQTTVRVEGLDDSEAEDDEVPHVGDEDDLPGAVVFDGDSEQDRMENYKKISDDLKVYEEEYKKCIDDIPDDNYTDEQIDECVGKNFIKVVLDIKYETLKIMSRADTRIRKYFISSCYTPAGTIEEFSVGCDYMERDTLDFMWNGLDFIELLEINKSKYLNEYGKIPREDFKKTMDELTGFAKVFFDLLNEIDSHKEITIMKLKTHIDDRTKLIIEEAKLRPDLPQPSTVSHTIQIEEKIIGGQTIETSEEGIGRKMKQVKQQSGKPAVNNRMVRQTGADARSAFSKARPAQGYVSRNPYEQKFLERQNKSRAFNPFASRLANLAAKGFGMNKGTPVPQRLRALSPNMRAQARVPFKNIHTRQYSHRSSL